MNLTWIYTILSLLVFANALPDDELTYEFISLTKYDYEEFCSKTANVEWTFINKPTSNTLRAWENAAIEYARHRMNETGAFTNKTIRNQTLEYSYNMVMKPGDALLEPDDYKKLVSLAGQAEITRLTGYYLTGTRKHFRPDVDRQLGRSVKPQDKLAAWSAWHQILSPLASNFSKNLELAQKAAIANGKNSVEEYWEMLCDAHGGYELAEQEWSRVSNLHKRVVNYVKSRLAAKYHIQNDTLPAHLLGSLRGYDWTPLAMDIVPYSDITYNVQKSLWEKEIVGEKLYKLASRLSLMILKTVPQADFWEESQFRGQCPSHLINVCRDGKMRISTCNEASLTNFISAHKNVGKILVSQISRHEEPILNIANRYSPLEEGVAEVFGILSTSHVWLSTEGLISNTTDRDESRIFTLMITALDVLPRMAYYLAADTWRIDAIKNNSLDISDLTSTWWKHRMEYEGINSSSPDLPTFLDDDYITSNKPYLSKFLGAILGFQIYEYLYAAPDVRYDPIEDTKENHDLEKMIRKAFANDWSDGLKKYLSIYEVNVESLLSYFSPLSDHLEEVEELNEEVKIPFEEERNLDVLQDTYRKKFNAPTTTTTTTTTTEKPISTKIGKKNVPIASPKSSFPEEAKTNATSSKTIEIPPANKTKEIPIQTESKSPNETGEDNEKPKAATSKAVWAVSAVLIATVTICIIAIFGRRRCRKAPKNRRYV